MRGERRRREKRGSKGNPDWRSPPEMRRQAFGHGPNPDGPYAIAADIATADVRRRGRLPPPLAHCPSSAEGRRSARVRRRRRSPARWRARSLRPNSDEARLSDFRTALFALGPVSGRVAERMDAAGGAAAGRCVPAQPARGLVDSAGAARQHRGGAVRAATPDRVRRVTLPHATPAMLSIRPGETRAVTPNRALSWQCLANRDCGDVGMIRQWRPVGRVPAPRPLQRG